MTADDDDDLTAVVELPAGLLAAGLVFLAADDWERLVAAMRAAGVDPEAVGDVLVHRVAPRVGGDSPDDDTP